MGGQSRTFQGVCKNISPSNEFWVSQTHWWLAWLSSDQNPGMGSTAVCLPYFHSEALMQPLSKRTMAAQTFSMHQAISALETLLKSKAFPTMPKKGCFTTKRLNFKGDALGIPIRPGLPKARETMECVHKYILSLGESKALSHAIEFPSSEPLVPPPPFPESAPDIRYKAYQRMQTLRRRAGKG